MTTKNMTETEPRVSRIAHFKQDMKANAWLFIATVTYLVTLYVLQENADWDPRLGVTLTLLPLVPGVIYLLKLWKSLKSKDELQRRIQLEAWAFALGGTVLVSTALNVLNANDLGFENYPHGLEIGGTYLTVFILWSVGVGMATARYR